MKLTKVSRDGRRSFAEAGRFNAPFVGGGD
jgi:hypothetical protein